MLFGRMTKGERITELELEVVKLQEQVRSLDKQMRDVQSGQTYFLRTAFPSFGLPKRVPLREVVAMLVDHLDLVVEHVAPRPEGVALLSKKGETA